MVTAASLLGAALVLIALFVTPRGERIASRIDLSEFSPPPCVLAVSAQTANIDLVISGSARPQLLVDGELHGFGLHRSRLAASV